MLPEPKLWAATFIQAAMEVAGGLRSAGQLVRWTTPEVHAILVRRGALTARARRGIATASKPRVRALVACAPRAGVCEVSAVIAEPDRVRAVAFRMEGLHGRWRVTELEIG
ncbi:MAG TPA: Rv3235 family protein [Kineosporiaceae bacterium]|nr:Rv3235 family protein [Kineosporiaceae bacterium]